MFRQKAVSEHGVFSTNIIIKSIKSTTGFRIDGMEHSKYIGAQGTKRLPIEKEMLLVQVQVPAVTNLAMTKLLAF